MSALLERYERQAQETPDELAVVYQREPYSGVEWTWLGLLQRAMDIQACLVESGAHERSLYALELTDHPDVIPALIATWRLNSAAVLLDSKWGRRLTESILAHSGPELLLTIEPKLEIIRLEYQPQPPDLLPDAAFLGYTSGSTGDPKAIVFEHDRLVAGTEGNVAASLRLRGSRPSRLGCSMRMSGSGVINLHYTWALLLRSAVVVLPELNVKTARDYWSRISQYEIDQTFLVPQLIELLNHLAVNRDPDIRGPLCFTGSAPLSVKTQQRFQRRFGLPLFNAYGLSETMSAAFFGHRGSDGMATIQIGAPERTRSRLRAPTGTIVEGCGEGELELTGDQVFAGYFRNPQATELTLVDGWLRTGDIVRRDENGIHQIVGRSKDVVMKGSYAIYLSEIEEATAGYPDILEAAAVPLQLANSAEDIGLLVRLMPGAVATADEILALLRNDLGPQRAPCRVVVIDDPLPRGGQEKLSRVAILEYWSKLAGVPNALRRNWT